VTLEKELAKVVQKVCPTDGAAGIFLLRILLFLLSVTEHIKLCTEVVFKFQMFCGPLFFVVGF